MASGVEEIEIVPTAAGLRVHGVASTPRPCVSAIGNRLALISCGVRCALPVPLLSGHSIGKPIGEVYLLRRSAACVYVRAALFETVAALFARKLINEGSTTCFSVLSGDPLDGAASDESIVEGYRFGSPG